jgi:uncharacterized membrane protein YhaH (DUF805 family)
MHSIAMWLQDTQPNQEAIQHMMVAMMAILPIIFLVIIAIIMVPCWFILKKAGFTPWLCLLCLIPSIGLVVLLYVLAFADWKVAPAPQAGWQPRPPIPQPPQPPYTPPHA